MSRDAPATFLIVVQENLEKGSALWLRPVAELSRDPFFASSLVFNTSILSIYFCTSGHVLQFKVNRFSHLAEHGNMQKQSSQALFSPRLLLTRKSYTVHSRHLHFSFVNHSIPRDQLKSWSSTNRPSKRICSGVVTGLHQKRQIRRESTIEQAIGAEKETQNKAPWHREGSDMPPVARQRSAGPMIKGSESLCVRLR